MLGSRIWLSGWRRPATLSLKRKMGSAAPLTGLGWCYGPSACMHRFRGTQLVPVAAPGQATATTAQPSGTFLTHQNQLQSNDLSMGGHCNLGGTLEGGYMRVYHPTNPWILIDFELIPSAGCYSVGRIWELCTWESEKEVHSFEASCASCCEQARKLQATLVRNYDQYALSP